MNKYLVYVTIPDDGPYVEIKTAHEIFSKMDMSDCSGEYLEKLFWLPAKTAVDPVPCTFVGKWYNLNDPLRMEIYSNDGYLLDVGYGTDH